MHMYCYILETIQIFSVEHWREVICDPTTIVQGFNRVYASWHDPNISERVNIRVFISLSIDCQIQSFVQRAVVTVPVLI